MATITSSKFNGRLVLYSTHVKFAGPKVVEGFNFEASFDEHDTWVVDKDHFHFVEEDIEVGPIKADLHVTLEDDAHGRTEGDRVVLDSVFKFSIRLGLKKASTLHLRYDTHASHAIKTKVDGRPLNRATGELALVAKGEFKGSLLGEETCVVLMEGRFTPNPWADSQPR